MSKHKRNRDLLKAAEAALVAEETTSPAAEVQEPVVEQPAVQEAAQEVAAPSEPVAPETPVATETQEAPAEAEQPVEQPKEEDDSIPQPSIPDAPAPEEKKDVPPPPPPPKPEPVVQEPPVNIQTTRKIVMSSDLLPKPKNPIQARREAPNRLPPGAVRLAQLFDEYEHMLAVKSDDAKECERRVMKLYELMNTACSVVNIKSEPATNAMIKIVFDRLMKGWGKYYTEKTMFKRDYMLNNPTQIDRFNAFWVAMIQLVQAATEGTRVSFDPRALMHVIKNETVTKVIVRFRDAIVERNEIEASNKPL